MRRFVATLIPLLILLGLVQAVMAQSTPLLAYVNASSQLAITSADGAARWIVTNPGEQIVPTAKLTWSPDGSQLFFAVQQGGAVSLRIATPASQSVVQIGTANGTLSGGNWLPNNRAVIAASPEGISQWATDGSGQTLIVPGGQLPAGQTISPDGNFIFYLSGSTPAIASLSNGAQVTLPGNNNAASVQGFWADRAPVLTYWAFGQSGTAVLHVVNPTTGEILSLDSGSAVPLTPVGWTPDGLVFVYRSASGVMAADFSCIARGCGGSVPAPVSILPVSAGNIFLGRGIFFTLDGSVFGANLNCITNGGCTNAPIEAVSANAPLRVNGDTVAFTAADGTIHTLQAQCATSNNCSPSTTGIAGQVISVGPRGSHLLVNSNNQIQILSLGRISLLPITGAGGNVQAVWQ